MSNKRQGTYGDKFYNSMQWRRVSKLFLKSKHYICERCGGVGELAHHKIRLDRFNVNKPEIALNFDNLECLCLSCHNSEHGETGSATAAGVSFDSAGNVVYVPAVDEGAK
jgi:5-methylcytosine-specific restriction endonuclease McrA